MPTVRKGYQYTAGEPAPLTPASGYYGCIALRGYKVPGQENPNYKVVLYVGNLDPNDPSTAALGVTWIPTEITLIVDTHQGFDISNGPAIEAWLNRSDLARPSGPGSVTG